MKMQLTREVTIRGIHNLENPKLSPAENESLYGICYGQHGHHYKVRVTIEGKIDSRSSLLMDRDALDRILRENLVDPLDGKDLNRIFSNTSGEALAIAIYDRLKGPLPNLVRVGIQETRKNYFEYQSQS